MTEKEVVTLYNDKLTPTERKYYECWIYWKRFKVQPWRFLNKKIITRDLLLALNHIDMMYHAVMEQKNLRDKNKEQQEKSFNAYTNTQHLNRSSNVQSVL